MSSDTSHIQFSRHIWQAVNEQARRCLLSREFCPEQSKIDNLRCVHFEEEIESCYGRQLWYFEAMGVDPIGRRHKLFGALEFSVQYGLLEACQAALFDDSDHRQRFLNAATQPIRSRIWGPFGDSLLGPHGRCGCRRLVRDVDHDRGPQGDGFVSFANRDGDERLGIELPGGGFT